MSQRNNSVNQCAVQDITMTKRVTADDLTNTGVASTQTISLFEIPADGIVEKVGFYLNTNFDGASSSDLAVIVGDASDDNGFIVSATIHEDGTAVSSKLNTGAYFNDLTTDNVVNQKVYDAASTGTISAIFTPTGDSLSDIDTGEITFFAKITDFSKIR
jgi:hypothetical protein